MAGGLFGLSSASGSGIGGIGSQMEQGEGVSGGMAILGDIFGGLSQEQSLNAQATRYQQQAGLDLYQGGLDVQKNEKAGVADLSAAKSAAGAGGVVSSGSPHQAAMESINHTNMEDAAARFSAKVKNVNDLYEAKVQRNAGQQAMGSGIASAATTAAMMAVMFL